MEPASLQNLICLCLVLVLRTIWVIWLSLSSADSHISMDSDSDPQESGSGSSEDEDYVPDDESEDSEMEQATRRSNRVQKSEGERRSLRKRGGIRLEESNDEESEETDEEEEEEEGFETIDDLKRERAEEKQKERTENLWQNFKADTAETSSKQSVDSDPAEPTKEEDDDEKNVQPTKPSPPNTTETKYSFAGEDVVVSKSLATGKETSKQGQTEGNEDDSKKNTAPAKSVPGASKRSGLGAILGSISKKPKISTLQKSKLDWEDYKEEEGLEDELKSAKDTGYLDRQEFLQRTDVRQFDIEKKTRLSSSRLKK